MAVLVFSTAEQAAWSRLGADEQPTAFYRWWARKEAYLKGTGMGIADGLEHATLGLDAAEARLISDTRAPEAPTRWHIRPLDVYPGYEGAVALALHHPLEAVRIRTLEVGPDFFLHPT